MRKANSGSFKPGNPGGGRPAIPLDVVELARQATRPAIERLAQIVDDPEAPPAAVVRAAEVLLNRGWGTAPQEIKVKGEMVHHVKRIILQEEG